jgi:hypothetical protein
MRSDGRWDPRTRFRAITAELDSAKPRGKEAVLLLVEADQYPAENGDFGTRTWEIRA